MFDEITVAAVFSYILVFCRIGAGMMLLPGISEAYISPMARLVAALGITGVVVPIIQPSLPSLPDSVIALFLLFAGEVIIGVLIGTIAKILLSTMHIAGDIIAYQMGLSSAMMFDPSQGTQSSVISTFMSILALMLIMATNLHHVLITGLVDSYTLFSPAAAINTGSMTELVEATVSGSFTMGVKIAAPLIVIGLIINLGAGIMGRLMPQMQVFFIMMPLQLALGFFIFMITLSGGMMWFMDYYAEIMGNFVNIN
jgi:flagellar biosynthetic protein FliR